MNPDLQQLHDLLLAQHEALYNKLDDVTDPAAAQAIVTEMSEILHRIDLVQGLLFRQTTSALKKSVQKVEDADSELTEAIKSAQSATDFIKGVSSYLAVVDQAIDLAKTLAAA
jgi:exonuclease VII small subunit